MPATRLSGREARGPCRSVTRSRNRVVLVAFLGCGAGARRRPGATGHSARTQARNPARVEAGARARRSSHRSRPPRVASGVAASAVRCWWRARDQARTTPFPRRVAGQGVSHRGQSPDGQVERPGAQGAAAVQGQGDAEAGEDQGGGVGDGGFQGGDGGLVAGGFGHAVLGGEADCGGGRGQGAQAGGGVAQPQARAVRGGPVVGRGAGAASVRGQREGDDGGQGEGAAGGEGRDSCRMTRCARMSGFRCHAARMRRRVRTRLLRGRTAGGRAGTSLARV